ncbi:hypothetical protein WH47_05464, partial [Habropoda laboriosa]
KKGGDHPPHMDATPKGPSVPPTPDILLPLFSRRISNLNVRAPFIVLHPRQRSRRISGRTSPLDAPRTTETTTYASSLSYTCLNFSRIFHRKLKQFPILQYHHVHGDIGEPVRSRKKNDLKNYTGTTTTSSILTSRNASRSWYVPTYAGIIFSTYGGSKSFFTHTFTPRRSCRKFDAFFTTPVVANRRRAGKVLLRGVTFHAKHIHRLLLRPKAPNYELQPNRPRKQCRAVLPRVLCKVSSTH